MASLSPSADETMGPRKHPYSLVPWWSWEWTPAAVMPPLDVPSVKHTR